MILSHIYKFKEITASVEQSTGYYIKWDHRNVLLCSKKYRFIPNSERTEDLILNIRVMIKLISIII